MKILNITQHSATPEQIAQGVVDVPEIHQAKLKQLLTFNSLPNKEEIRQRAISIGEIITEADAVLHPDSDELVIEAVMIGGAPYLMSQLEEHCKSYCKVLYAFSVRESVEEIVDGKTIKKSVFKHAGFIEV